MADFVYPDIATYGQAYRRGRCSPLDVAQRLLAVCQQADRLSPPMRFFISQIEEDMLQQAEASTSRFQQGDPLGPLDGVPVAVKDELDQLGYPTTVGTKFLGDAPAANDATLVARLRAAGAVLVGKANMHEIGLGVTGINPHHGSARNPHDPARVTGGSSSGSAATVAAGLCPLSIGADGGGSIRIPAALCGIAGLKPTFGRVSEHGVYPLCFSVAHVGPLATTVADLALAMEIFAGPDPADPVTLGHPKLSFDQLDDGVEGLRLGWCQAWAERADGSVRRACEQALERLKARGAQVVPVNVERRELIRPVQSVTIGVEMAAAQYEYFQKNPDAYGSDARLLLGLASKVPGVEYVRAQRLRTLVAEAFDRALADVDLLLTPMTAVPAPPIADDAEIAGESNEVVLKDLTAFSFAANLTGQPAASVPVGYDEQGLPLALQLTGRHWDEALILRVARAVEADVAPRKPAVFYDILP